MSGNVIPDDLRRFVVVNALTVPDVEALMIFRGARDAAWTAGALGERLYVTPARAARVVERLAALGAIAADGGAWGYRPRTPELDLLFSTLEDYYARHLVEITRLIHAAEDNTAQHFADAFRFRKDKEKP